MTEDAGAGPDLADDLRRSPAGPGAGTITVGGTTQERLTAIETLIASWDWRTADVEEGAAAASAPEAAPPPGEPLESIASGTSDVHQGLVGTLQWPVSPDEAQTRVVAPPAHVDDGGPPHARAPEPRTRSATRAVVWAVTAGVIMGVGVVIGWDQAHPSTPPAPPHRSTVASGTAATTPAADERLKLDFIQVAKGMYQANAAATQALDSSGGSDTTATVFKELVPYSEAMSTYEYELHFLPWTPDLVASSTALHDQLGSFLAFLRTITSTTSTTLGAWLSTFQTDARATQLADNRVRAQLGLPTGASYP